MEPALWTGLATYVDMGYIEGPMSLFHEHPGGGGEVRNGRDRNIISPWSWQRSGIHCDHTVFRAAGGKCLS